MKDITKTIIGITILGVAAYLVLKPKTKGFIDDNSPKKDCKCNKKWVSK